MNYNRVNSKHAGAGWINRVHLGRLPLLTKDQLKASRYLKQRNIFELLNFLLGHILCDSPKDPLTYLDELLERCLHYRWGLCDPPLLFTPAHIDALFGAFDPGATEFISVDQYLTAMVTLGICTHSKEPEVDEEGRVSKEYFCRIAEACLLEMLEEMLAVPAGKGGGPSSSDSLPVPPPPPPSPSTVVPSLTSIVEGGDEGAEEAVEEEKLPAYRKFSADPATARFLADFIDGGVGDDGFGDDFPDDYQGFGADDMFPESPPGTPSHEKPSEEPEGHETPVEDAVGHVTLPEEAGLHEAPLEDAVGHDTPLEDAVGHDTPLEDAGLHEAHLEEPVQRDTPSEEPVQRETPSEEPVQHETPSEKPVQHETPSEEPVQHETPSEEPVQHETPSEEPVQHETPMKERGLHVTLLEDPVLHEASPDEAPPERPSSPPTEPPSDEPPPSKNEEA